LVYVVVFLLLIAAAACIGETIPKEAASTKVESGVEVDEEPTQYKDMPKEPVMYQDFLYPNAEFLFEIDGIGGPMLPCRFMSRGMPLLTKLRNITWRNYNNLKSKKTSRRMVTAIFSWIILGKF